MESTGHPNKIHVSNVTADLLVQAGKGHWLERRLDTVVAKGKGELETYWLSNKRKSSDTASTVSDSQGGADEIEAPVVFKDRRIVDWNVAVLEARIKVVVAHRRNVKPCDIDLGPSVVSELERFVQGIAYLYKPDNPFHNFLHASHVTMAVTKMLSRIVASEDGGSSSYTKGIADDPMTHFAVVFGALVHDGASGRSCSLLLVAFFLARSFLTDVPIAKLTTKASRTCDLLMRVLRLPISMVTREQFH
jgi:Adenylate and Guanylate cyclase catalytic domain